MCAVNTMTLKLGHVENESRSHFVGGCVGRWVHVCSQHHDSETRSH